MGRIPWEEKSAKNEATKKRHAESRAKYRKIWDAKTHRLQSELRTVLAECGLTQMQLSDFSGVDSATILKLRKGIHKTVQVTTLVSVAEACGYEIKLVPKDPYDDIFREYRIKKLPPLPKKDSKNGQR